MGVTIDLAMMVMQPSSPDRAGASRHAPDDAFGISLTLRHVTPKGYTRVYAKLLRSNLAKPTHLTSPDDVTPALD
jgi:hypothetical protein